MIMMLVTSALMIGLVYLYALNVKEQNLKVQKEIPRKKRLEVYRNGDTDTIMYLQNQYNDACQKMKDQEAQNCKTENYEN